MNTNKLTAFFNRKKKPTDWNDNIFVPIVKTITPERVDFNSTFKDAQEGTEGAKNFREVQSAINQ